MKLVLPYPPSANHYKRHYCTANQKHPVRAHLTKEAQQFRLDVENTALVEGVRLLDGKLVALVDVYCPSERFDLDNALKLLMDAMQGLVYHNDRQIVEIHARRFIDRAKPRVEVTITAWKDQQIAMEGWL